MATAAPTLAPLRPGSRVVLRHHWLVRLTHWLNAIAIIILLMTGLNIFGAHPRLYWGDAGSVDQREQLWLEAGASPPWRNPTGWIEIAGTRFDTTGFIGVSQSPKGTPASLPSRTGPRCRRAAILPLPARGTSSSPG